MTWTEVHATLDVNKDLSPEVFHAWCRGVRETDDVRDRILLEAALVDMCDTEVVQEHDIDMRKPGFFSLNGLRQDMLCQRDQSLWARRTHVLPIDDLDCHL